jgi:hypothetical protein
MGKGLEPQRRPQTLRIVARFGAGVSALPAQQRRWGLSHLPSTPTSQGGPTDSRRHFSTRLEAPPDDCEGCRVRRVWWGWENRPACPQVEGGSGGLSEEMLGWLGGLPCGTMWVRVLHHCEGLPAQERPAFVDSVQRFEGEKWGEE